VCNKCGRFDVMMLKWSWKMSRCTFAGLTPGAPPAHMLPFSPLFYPYQVAMAQAAASGKGSSANMAELQRAAELQRQYLLDMIPPGPGQRHNWKT
jgi:hypothetical protein